LGFGLSWSFLELLGASFILHSSFFQASFKLLSSFFQASFKLLSSFFQASFKLLSSFFQAFLGASWGLLELLENFWSLLGPLGASWSFMELPGACKKLFDILNRFLSLFKKAF
jgi:hypothetical protein